MLAVGFGISRRTCRVAALPAFCPTVRSAPKVGDPPEAMNMRLVGHSGLQGRSAYMPTIFIAGRPVHRLCRAPRWHQGNPAPVNTVTGKNEINGTSIIDVTDPKEPKYLAHIPGRTADVKAGASQMTRMCDGRRSPRAILTPSICCVHSAASAHEIWNVGDPSQPKLVPHRWQLQGHAQELVGVRHRHRLPRVRRGRLARAHDRSL